MFLCPFFSDCGWASQPVWSVQHVLQHPVGHCHRIHWYTQLCSRNCQLRHRPVLPLFLPLPTGIPPQQHRDHSVSSFSAPYFTCCSSWQSEDWPDSWFSCRSSVSVATSDNNGTFIDTLSMRVFNVRVNMYKNLYHQCKIYHNDYCPHVRAQIITVLWWFRHLDYLCALKSTLK